MTTQRRKRLDRIAFNRDRRKRWREFSFHRDMNGKAITFQQWGLMRVDSIAPQICDTQIGPVRVSTVWIGIDTAFPGQPPQIFETMIFGEASKLDGRQFRYPTRRIAKIMHKVLCNLIRLEQEEQTNTGR